jgi:hypothetical protein
MADFEYSRDGKTAEAFPLCWPAAWPRAKRRERARFDTSFAKARDALFDELRIMGASAIILSGNLELRRDGLPYANQPEPSDPGIAVYFQWKGKPMTFACDRWDRARDNVQAIRKTIEAIRGIERWGASDMMERAFTAFEALPAPGQGVSLSCWAILDIEPGSSAIEIDRAYRRKAREAHPDSGGSREEWDRLQAAYEQAKAA